MSILRWKQKVMFADGGVLRDSGGGGGAPSSGTTYNTNIPEYAKPYVTNMLGATQAQLFNTNKVQTGTTDSGEPIYENQITGFKPYQPYSTNVNDYFAGYSPLQQQAQAEISNLKTPGQFGMGTDLSAQGGQNLMQTAVPAMAYGSQGAGIGAMGIGASQAGFGAGQAYENQATNPNDIARYMSPYMQNVVDYQKSQALRDFQMGQPMMQAKAVGQGAFGGNRLALQQSEAQRGLMSQLQGIEAQGAQKAFDTAQQAQQYRANLGLQGLGAGYQGLGVGLQGVQTGLQGVQGAQAGYQGAVGAGGTLGNIGAQQSQSDLARIALMNEIGGQMQGFEQGKYNQGISNYATAQQYPMMQLGFMSNMLRGLPRQSTTTQSYQATPSTYQQGVGGIGVLAGAKQAGLFKEGGTVKGLAGGGTVAFADTGAVQANPDSGATRGIQAQLASMDIEQLKQIAVTSPSEQVREMANELIAQKEIQAQAEQRAEQSMPQQPMMPSQGIAAAPAGSMDTLQAAGGGIIAFANKGTVPDVKDINTLESDEERLARIQKQQGLVGITGKPMEGYGKYIADQIAAQGDAESKMKGYNLMDIASRFGTTTGGMLYAGQKAVQESLPDIIKRRESLSTREGQLMKGQAEIENADRLEKMGFIKEGNDEREKGLNRIKDLQVANINKEATLRAAATSAGRPTDLMNIYKVKLAALGKTENPNDPEVQNKAMTQAISEYQMTGPKVAAIEAGKATEAIKSDPEVGQKGTLTQQLKILELKKEPNEKEQAKIKDLKNQIEDKKAVLRSRIERTQNQPTADNTPKVPRRRFNAAGEEISG